MQISSLPYKFQYAWGTNATSGYVTDPIPATSTGANASQSVGFPPITSLPIESGGVPPTIWDTNGALFYCTSWLQWIQAGLGNPPYDSTFQTNIGGYPKGAIIQSGTVSGKLFLSTADNNSTNPDAAGAGWVNYPVHGVQWVPTTGVGSFTVPNGVSTLLFMALWGGAGGGGAVNTSVQAASGGGSGGLCLGFSIAVTPGQTISYNIGAGGPGGVGGGGAGNAGNQSTLTIGASTWTAGAGQAGSGGSAGSQGGGTGGSASGAPLNFAGTQGSTAGAGSLLGADGGAAPWLGIAGKGSSGFAGAGSAPGGGGAGSGGTGGAAGGAGAAGGLLIVW